MLIQRVETLVETIRAASPTYLVSTPRMWEEVYALFSRRVNQEENCRGEKEKENDFLAETPRAVVMRRFKDALGSRLQQITSGGAALSPQVYFFS